MFGLALVSLFVVAFAFVCNSVHVFLEENQTVFSLLLLPLLFLGKSSLNALLEKACCNKREC